MAVVATADLYDVPSTFNLGVRRRGLTGALSVQSLRADQEQ
jgi:hypothetical protein